jgi:hypothetical protein
MPGAGVHAYRLKYHVEQSRRWSDRCPIWIPSAPTDGIGRSVRIQVQLPAGTDPLDDAFPVLKWNGTGRGSVTLGHIPAFVRAPFASASATRSWRFSERRVVDFLAVAILACASIAWAVMKGR